ncbi:Asp23/Gls24 family envelope stress response protein [Anaerococcus sp.]|uniref:Asp23/Gls24 family envelope stress response protein n=1 Tax=Anaerococcus sp. TaxID=1872515 RepID=UPI0027B92D08|nr:Asp23/Gls24 family envelope stress response protein [Anaerococcus sp.]MDU3136713.1 Asp23/Gls24 family envelope stress response protein [Anaerococcus prevotii]
MTEKKDRIEELNEGRELEYEESKLIIEDKVVAKIARIAINGVDGILEMKGNIADSIGSFFSGREEQSTAGVSVEVGEKEAKINLDVIIEYGKNATRIFQDIKRAVTNNIKEMTGLDVVTVNVDVVDVMTKQEYEKKNRESNKEREEQNRY